MEYIMLCSYWEKFHEGKTNNIKEIFRRLDAYEKLLFFSILFFALVIMVSNILLGAGYFKSGIVLAVWFVSIIMEIISFAILSSCSKERSIRKVKHNMKEKKAKFTSVHSWLKEMGYSRKREILQFLVRCENVLAEWEKDKREDKQHIERALSWFYIPTLLAIISWILASNKDMNDAGMYILLVFILTTGGVAVYILVLGIFNIIENNIYNDLRKMKYMIRDLWGVLDYCYDSVDEELEIVNLE